MVKCNTDKHDNDLFSIITNQNFVPIVDDSNVFIGIITRKSVIKYLQENNTILEKQ